MEALVYTFLLIGTLIILFFSFFFREKPLFKIYLSKILGVSLKKTEKNRIIKVPINKKVYTSASICYPLLKSICYFN